MKEKYVTNEYYKGTTKQRYKLRQGMTLINIGIKKFSVVTGEKALMREFNLQWRYPRKEAVGMKLVSGVMKIKKEYMLFLRGGKTSSYKKLLKKRMMLRVRGGKTSSYEKLLKKIMNATC